MQVGWLPTAIQLCRTRAFRYQPVVANLTNKGHNLAHFSLDYQVGPAQRRGGIWGSGGIFFFEKVIVNVPQKHHLPLTKLKL